MENEIYQILKKHKLPLKKREEVLTDLLLLFSVVGRSEQLCDHPRSERSYIGQNMLRCNKCGKEFS